MAVIPSIPSGSSVSQPVPSRSVGQSGSRAWSGQAPPQCASRVNISTVRAIGQGQAAGRDMRAVSPAARSIVPFAGPLSRNTQIQSSKSETSPKSERSPNAFTPEPSAEPGREPTREPTTEPGREPGREPTGESGRESTREPTGESGRESTREPTGEPTGESGREPTRAPTQALPLLRPRFVRCRHCEH